MNARTKLASCFADLLPDEPYFLIMGRDNRAIRTIEFWLSISYDDNLAPLDSQERLDEARKLIEKMQTWNQKNSCSHGIFKLNICKDCDNDYRLREPPNRKTIIK